MGALNGRVIGENQKVIAVSCVYYKIKHSCVAHLAVVPTDSVSG